MLHTKSLNDACLISDREDVVDFFEKVLGGIKSVSTRSYISKESDYFGSLVILDVSVLEFCTSDFYKRIDLIKDHILCIIPFSTSRKIVSYVEINFKYVLPFPIHYGLLFRYIDEIIKNLSEPGDFLGKITDDEYTLSKSLFGFFLGNSNLIKKVRTKIEKVSKIDSAVLLVGETGTGKSTGAEIIHKLSKRGKNKIQNFNISTVVDTLASSTFFGTKQGAYTDAGTSKGLFKMADKSTLFLDEIGVATPGVQTVLLTALSTGMIQKVGSDYFEKVDVRLISATNEDLRKKISDGSFRKDLFYRIADNIIRFPSLRERPEDIPNIVNSFVINKEKIFSEDSLNKLMEYNWPGNIRELLQCVNRAVETSKKETIYPENIDFGLFNN